MLTLVICAPSLESVFDIPKNKIYFTCMYFWGFFVCFFPAKIYYYFFPLSSIPIERLLWWPSTIITLRCAKAEAHENIFLKDKRFPDAFVFTAFFSFFDKSCLEGESRILFPELSFFFLSFVCNNNTVFVTFFWRSRKIFSGRVWDKYYKIWKSCLKIIFCATFFSCWRSPAAKRSNHFLVYATFRAPL